MNIHHASTSHRIQKALIPAAGKGIRAYEKTRYTSKVMLEIKGIPLLERNILLLRDQLHITDIIVIVGYDAPRIQNHFQDGSKLNVRISYIHCKNPESGLAEGIYLARDHFHEPFICILGDELYLNSNHKDCSEIQADQFAVCAVQKTNQFKKIRENYTLETHNGHIKKLIEKPEEIREPYLGCGTWILRPEIFEYIRTSPPSARTGKKDFVEILNHAIEQGKTIVPFHCQGAYFNINTIEAYNDAQYTARARNFDENKISVVIPTRNEEVSIGYVVKDFLPHADEVLVVNNQSTDQTARVAEEAGARVLNVQLKGYGDTIRYGLAQATGDILVVVEGDYTFRAKDLGKFLEYLKDADMVIGTRTTCELIEQGANMKGLLRFGNIFVAKLIELLWWSQEPRFTDVGCTYRAVWKDVYRKIQDQLKSTGPEFAPEMMIKILQAHLRLIEIPITYYPRMGNESKHSNNWLGISKTALKMLQLIAKERLSGFKQ
ncbi:MAG: glycosyltransferase [Candidatus Omnitrophica bacterium]|nr:glycosyltransferase [Candidatus Omnitrophota bacterium]